MSTPYDHQLMTRKELALALRRSVRFVDYMKAKGFMMPGGMATVAEARAWLARNPAPSPRSTTHVEPEPLQEAA